MTTQAPPRMQASATPTPRHRPAIAIAGAAVVVVVTILMILVFGLVPVPSFPSLAEEPDPSVPGTVAFVRSDQEQQCLSIVPAGGGEITDLQCTTEWYGLEALAWTPDGALAAAAYAGGAPEVAVFDTTTGEEVDRVAVGDPDPVAAWQRERQERDDGSRLLLSGGVGGEATLRVRDPDGSRRDLIHVEGPRDYRFTAAQWSPDGAWVLVADTRGRLLVVAAEGDPNPRTLVAGRGDVPQGFAWYVPGETAYTFEPPTSS